MSEWKPVLSKKAAKRARQAELAEQARSAAEQQSQASGYQDDDDYKSSINLSPESKQYILSYTEAEYQYKYPETETQPSVTTHSSEETDAGVGTEGPKHLIPQGIVSEGRNIYLKRLEDAAGNLPTQLVNRSRSGIEQQQPNMANRYIRAVASHTAEVDNIAQAVTDLSAQVDPVLKQAGVEQQLRNIKGRLIFVNRDLSNYSNRLLRNDIAAAEETSLETAVQSLEALVLRLSDEEAKLLPMRTVISTGVPPGRLEKIKIPVFSGDLTRYQAWKDDFLSLTANVDPAALKAYLVNHLSGKAREWIQESVDMNHSYEQILKQLDAHFGDPKNVCDHTLRKCFGQKGLKELNVDKLHQFFSDNSNIAASVKSLGYTLEQILAKHFMLMLPGPYRSELERLLDKNDSYTHDDLRPLVEQVARIYKNVDTEQSEVVATKVVTTQPPVMATPTQLVVAPAQATPTQAVVAPSQSTASPSDSSNTAEPNSKSNGYRGGWRGRYRGRTRGRGRGTPTNGGRNQNQNNQTNTQPNPNSQWADHTCDLCGYKGHLMRDCKNVRSGHHARLKLRALDRCDACLAKKSEHGNSCNAVTLTCQRCYSAAHYSVTCMNDHPGSWILNKSA